MKVSLRKANALQEQLNELIKTRPNADHEVNVIDYELWRSEVENAQTKYYKEVESKLEMVEARFSIRCLLYTSPSPRDKRQSRMPSSA